MQFTKPSGRCVLPTDIEEVVALTPELGNEYQTILDSLGELKN